MEDKSFVDVIQDYKKLEEMLENAKNYICYETQNGRRMIITNQGGLTCTAINKHFEIICWDVEKYYDSPLELIKDHLSKDAKLKITDILITLDKAQAYEYLQERKS